jgi:hypothetical protein
MGPLVRTSMLAWRSVWLARTTWATPAIGGWGWR